GLDLGPADRLRVVVEADAVGQRVELHLPAVDRLGEVVAVDAAELLDLVRGDELHALRLAELAAELAALLVEHVAQEPRPAHDPRDLRRLPKADALGELVADEAPTHHEHALRRVGLLDDRVGVVDGLEAEALSDLVGAGPGRRFGAAAGRDQQRVVLERLAVVGAHDLGLDVDLRDPRLEMDVEVLLRVVLDGAHEDLLAPHLAAKVSRQRDAVVERVLLRRDHDDRGVRLQLAQLFGAGLPGDAVADDDVLARQLRGRIRLSEKMNDVSSAFAKSYPEASRSSAAGCPRGSAMVTRSRPSASAS